MILTCPSCATRYMAEGASFQPSGRMVRCAGCSHSWFQEPPDDLPLRALPDYSGQGSYSDELTTLGEVRSDGLGLAGRIAGWAVLAGLALAVVTAAYQYRVGIVQIWPQAATLYSLFGESINTRGLTFQSATYQLEYQGDIPVLAVTGEVMNTSDADRPVPRIKVSLRDAERQQIFDWTFAAPVKQLAPNEKSAFVTRLGSPPEAAQELVIAFEAAAESEKKLEALQ